VPQPRRRRYRDAIRALIDRRFDAQVGARESRFHPSTAGRDELLGCMARPDSVRRFGFAEIAALIAPRPLHVEHDRVPPSSG